MDMVLAIPVFKREDFLLMTATVHRPPANETLGGAEPLCTLLI
jgi:hypothetical protein